MKLKTNQLGLATINNESQLIHILNINGKKITVRIYNSEAGRWLKSREIDRFEIKDVFFKLDGKPQMLNAPTKRMAA